MLPTLVVNHTFLPLIKKGKEAQQTALIVAKKLMEMLKTIDCAQSPFLSGAKTEATECARLLEILAGSDKYTVEELDAVMTSKNGSKYLMKQAVLQTDFYKSLEASLRSNALASKVMAPKLHKTLHELDRSLDGLEQAVQELQNFKMLCGKVLGKPLALEISGRSSVNQGGDVGLRASMIC